MRCKSFSFAPRSDTENGGCWPWHKYSTFHLSFALAVIVRDSYPPVLRSAPFPAQALENTVTMSVALELTVEQPFSVTTTLAGPPRVPQLLLPSGGLSTAAALGGGGVEGRAALPLRSRCMLTAALRATAPCEVRCCMFACAGAGI